MLGFSNGQSFVSDKMQADDLWRWSCRAVAKMTIHRIAHHRTQFLDGFPLGGDGVAEREPGEGDSGEKEEHLCGPVGGLGV